jgi:hypothetical protein
MALQIDCNVSLLYYRFSERGFQTLEIAGLTVRITRITDAGNKEVLNIRKYKRMRRLKFMDIVSVHISGVCMFLVSRAAQISNRGSIHSRVTI